VPGSRGRTAFKAAFMTESIIYFAIGFLAAALSVLLIIPFVSRRTGRTATQGLEAAIPSKVAKIMAEKDLLRAEFAASTQHFETVIEQIKTQNASQLAELGRRDDAINRLGTEVDALRDQLRAAEEQSTVAECILSEKESELAKLTGHLNEQSTIADVQKIEISAVKIEVEALKEALEGSGSRLKAVEDRRDAERAEFAAASERLMDERYQAERALSAKESELSRLSARLTERSALADIEISAFKAEIEAMRQSLDGARAELKTFEADPQHTALQTALRETERALSEKESEITKLRAKLDEQSALVDGQTTQMTSLETKIETLKQALDTASMELKAIQDCRDVERIEFASASQEAKRTLAEKELEITELRGQLHERSVLAELQDVEISALEAQIVVLKESLHGVSADLKGLQDCRDAERMEFEASARRAERALSEKEAELAKLVRQLDERSTFIDAQKIEIVAHKIEVETLKKTSEAAIAELRAIQDRRDVHQTELKAANNKLIEARNEFEQFRRRVADLVKQVVAQNADDKIRAEDLENRVVEQSRLLDERAIELGQLRGEIEIACKAEADLRSTTIEVEGRTNSAIQDLKAESAKLQAAFDRANAERMRLAHEVAKLKRQAEEPRAA
jgi:chromosome segregation ATPase